MNTRLDQYKERLGAYRDARDELLDSMVPHLIECHHRLTEIEEELTSNLHKLQKHLEGTGISVWMDFKKPSSRSRYVGFRGPYVLVKLQLNDIVLDEKYLGSLSTIDLNREISRIIGKSPFAPVAKNCIEEMTELVKFYHVQAKKLSSVLKVIPSSEIAEAIGVSSMSVRAIRLQQLMYFTEWFSAFKHTQKILESDIDLFMFEFNAMLRPRWRSITMNWNIPVSQKSRDVLRPQICIINWFNRLTGARSVLPIKRYKHKNLNQGEEGVGKGSTSSEWITERLLKHAHLGRYRKRILSQQEIFKGYLTKWLEVAKKEQKLKLILIKWRK